MFGRWLNLVPVRASRMRIASEQLGKCHARVAELKASLEKARAASQEWKAKAHDADQRVAQQAKLIERIQAQAARAAEQQARELAQLRTRISGLTEKRARDVADLRAHLATAERDLAMARDHLMTIDVKLDILEGAANVLDNRTRAILSARTAPDSEVTSQ